MDSSSTNLIEKIKETDRKHHMHPFTNPMIQQIKGPSGIVSSARDQYIYTDNGKKYLDAASGLACVNIGYGRTEIAEAVRQTMTELSYCHSFTGNTHQYTTLLIEALLKIAKPNISKVFFANSGSEAVESAVKLSRLYWELQGNASKRHIISRENAYHGSTYLASLLSTTSGHKAKRELECNQISHVESPFHFKNGRHLNEDEYGLKAAKAVENEILRLGPDSVAAFIGEPIQNTGGVVIPPMTYWPEVERICRKYDVLLIADETVSGFGRNGYWFANEYFGFDPDFIISSKGLSSGYLPISALLIDEEVSNRLSEYNHNLTHGFTATGHPATATAALKNIEILDRENLINYVRDTLGPYFCSELQKLNRFDAVGEVRCLGLSAAVQFEPGHPHYKDMSALVADYCTANGVIVRAGSDCISMQPPLTCEKATIDELIGCLTSALAYFSN